MTVRVWLFLMLAALISGCAGLPGATVQHVDDRPLEFVAHADVGPVVVFENGLAGRMEWWSKVLPALENDTAYFAYNRPGYGKSAPVESPRDGAHIVKELRATLKSLGMHPPYVLVGHSLGGLYMQLFARQHPQDVAALILVDSTHPLQLEGAGAIDKQSLWVRSAFKVLVTGTAQQELDLLSRTGEQVLSLPTLTGIPVSVLSASAPLNDTSEVGQFAHQKRADIAHLYPGSKQVWVNSSHAIPLEKPEAVVDAIRSALASARNGKH